MSADVLREAAALMRAEAREPHMIAVLKRRTTCGATVHHGPEGSWHRDPDHPKWCNAQPGGATQPAPSDYERTKAVALAVADWLDATAAEHESSAADPRVNSFFAEFDTAPDFAAIAVANAYLGRTA